MKKNNLYKIGLSVVIIMSSLLQPVNAGEAKEPGASGKLDITPASLPNLGLSGINIVLYDGTDRVVYNDRIPAGTTFEEAFDLSSVREGTYRLVKQLENVQFSRVFNVQSNGIVFSQSYYSFTPRFNPEEKLLSVMFMNSAQNHVRVKITDAWDTIFEDSYRKPGNDLTLNYELESFPKGNYTLHLVSGMEEFSYMFEVE